MRSNVADSRRVEQILAEARASYRAPPAVRERVRRELTAIGAFRGEESEPFHPAARLPDARVAGVSKPMVALLAGLTFIAGFWLGGRNAKQPSVPALPPAGAAPTPTVVTTPALNPTPTLSAPPAGEAAAAELPAQVKRPAVADPPVKRADKPAEKRKTLSSELALLQRAEHAIRSGEPELALSFLADLDRRHPETQLGEERVAARLMARCARGDVPAKMEATQWLQERRASVYSDRVRELCELEH
jgi:hypothetical protein